MKIPNEEGRGGEGAIPLGDQPKSLQYARFPWRNLQCSQNVDVCTIEISSEGCLCDSMNRDSTKAADPRVCLSSIIID